MHPGLKIPPNITRKVLPSGWLLIILLFTLSACGGGEQAPVTRTAQLTCAEDCSLQGQCGRNQSDQVVVLANSGQPATKNHNLTMTADTAVNIINETSLLLMFPRDGHQAPQVFYEVQGENGAVGWVAGWCVVLNE